MTNQLVAEAQQQIDDLDEFAGMSVVDIAHAITLWPEGSEDQSRAIAAIRARAPGIGHNKPPLSEALDDELAGLLERQRQMLDIAATAVIVDEPSAAKVLDLAGKMAGLEKELDDARKARSEPYRDAVKLINDRFNRVIDPLTIARQGADGRGGLRRMLTAWEDKKNAEAEAERQRVLAEARRRQEEAEAARKAAEEKAAAGKGTVADELAVMRAQDEAERLEQRASAIRPEPTRGHLGQARRSREIRFDIVNIRETLSWLLKQSSLANQIRHATETIIGKHLHSLGVDAVERGVKIPGVETRVERGAVSVRR